MCRPALPRPLPPRRPFRAWVCARAQAIKEKREQRFWDKRMAPNKAVQKARDLAEVQQGLDLLVSPLVSQEQQKLTNRVAAKAKAKAE